MQAPVTDSASQERYPLGNMKPRLKPHQLVIGLGLAIALFTLVSGIVPSYTNWHDDSVVQREVFGNVPTALKLSFYSIIPILLVYGAYMFAMRVKNWERGRPDNRRTTVKKRPATHG